MLGTAAEFAALADWCAQFITIVARLSFVIFFLPGVGEQVVPTRVRMMVLLAAALLISGLGLANTVSFTPLSGFFALLAGEVFIGFVLGVSLRLVIWVLSIAGSIIAQSIGLAQFLGVALEHEAQTITANMLSMAGAALLLTANLHVGVIASMTEIYAQVPLGGLANLDFETALSSLISGFSLAVMIAWPFLAVNLLYNISLGFINKALPQMMVAFVGAPFMVGAGTILLAGAITSLLILWQSRVPDLIGWL